MINSFSDWLKLELKEQGRSQQWLADKTGLTYVEINEIANGRRAHPTLNTIRKICKAMDVPLGPVLQMLCAEDDA